MVQDKAFRNKSKIKIGFLSLKYKSTKQEIKQSVWHLKTTKRQKHNGSGLYAPENKTYTDAHIKPHA